MFSNWKRKLALAITGLVGLIMVYFVGRRNRKGEVSLAIASKELTITLDKQKTLEHDLDNLQKKKVAIVSDIVEHELLHSNIESTNALLSDADVADALRKRNLIK